MSFQDEKIVETKSCRLCSASFDITDKDREFYEKVSPAFNSPLTRTLEGEKGAGRISPETSALLKGGIIKELGDGKIKYLIPTPTLCPDCRQQRRFSFRNERDLYKRKCDLSGKEIISIYSPDKPYTVYDQEIWWSDQWNPFLYGVNFDFNKGFFLQFKDFLQKVPVPNMFGHRLENSDYSLYSADLKDCYQVVSIINGENLLYGYQGNGSKNSVDFTYAIDCERCYEVVNCVACNNCTFSMKCTSGTNLSFCYACENCSDCVLCFNLANASYCICNKQYTKEEYIKEIQKYLGENTSNTRKIFQSKLPNIVRKFSDIFQSENCTGNFLNSCKDCQSTFDMSDAEEMKYCSTGRFGKVSMDCNFTTGELCYESLSPFPGYKEAFSIFGWECTNCYYVYLCKGCLDCFACVGLKNKQYCILNKQYTKEEYETLVPRIIEHMMKPHPNPLLTTGEEEIEWGEFFPSSLSPFGYNETVAQEYFPLTREEALRKGFYWSDYEAPFPKVEKSIPASKLPDDIAKIPDDILNWAIECEITKKPFRIIKQELEFYRKHHLPIPHKHPDQRHKERMALRNPRKLYTRHCDKCQKEIQTTYAPERPEIVYCEECYNKEVY